MQLLAVERATAVSAVPGFALLAMIASAALRKVGVEAARANAYGSAAAGCGLPPFFGIGGRKSLAPRIALAIGHRRAKLIGPVASVRGDLFIPTPAKDGLTHQF